MQSSPKKMASESLRDDSSVVRLSPLVKIAVRQYITSGSSSSFAITIILLPPPPEPTSALSSANEQWLLLRVLRRRPAMSKSRLREGGVSFRATSRPQTAGVRKSVGGQSWRRV